MPRDTDLLMPPRAAEFGHISPEPAERTYDPTMPITPFNGPAHEQARSIVRRSQHQRRSVILGTIRQLIADDGYQGVTVRRIAERSGYAVQTIYNLVGPRDEAIIEAISEYPLYLGRTANPDFEDPEAIMKTIDWQIASVRNAPGFCRQVCRIYFTSDRHIYNEFHDRQVRSMHALLVKQQRHGIIRPEVHCRDLAEHLMLFAGSLYLDWTDRDYSLDRLAHRLKSGYSYMLASALTPKIARYQQPVAAE